YHFEQTELNEIVSSVLSAMEYQIKMNDFMLEVFLSPEKIPIYADKDAIEEALINLISNSIKYSQENKKITITTFNEGSQPAISIKDKGIGINDKDIQRIFEPYERVKSDQVKNKSGTGIGLTVVKHIMDAHKAELRVNSQPGEGTEFIIVFNNFSQQTN
ncbi:MAG: ATP-binding protein, partial [Ignavibacteriaceae bacterium]